MLTSAHASPAFSPPCAVESLHTPRIFFNLLERTLYTLVSYINLHAVDLHIISLGTTTPPTVQLLQTSVVPLLFKAGWHH